MSISVGWFVCRAPDSCQSLFTLTVRKCRTFAPTFASVHAAMQHCTFRNPMTPSAYRFAA